MMNKNFNGDKLFFDVRCFTCGKMISGKEQKFAALMQKYNNRGKCMDILGYKRICCRRMFLGSLDIDFENLEYHQMNEMKAPNNDSQYFVAEKKDRCIVHIEISKNRITNKPMTKRPTLNHSEKAYDSSKKRKIESTSFDKNGFVNELNQSYNNPFSQNKFNQNATTSTSNFNPYSSNDEAYSPVAPTEKSYDLPYKPVSPNSNLYPNPFLNPNQ